MILVWEDTTVDGNEFGYFHSPSEGCVDEYKVMVFNERLIKQQILSYEDSPGEAERSIRWFIKNGFNFWGCEFRGRENFDFTKKECKGGDQK